MKTMINNFCDDGSQIEVYPYTHEECGQLVSVAQDSGSCSFHHSMRPEQARAMAAALIVAANSFDKPVEAA